ncbi:hypothetical protein X777_00976 [Ooceraea biroi]|uniref:Zinc finger protein n=1 Tax=Ooceraea biroi TaxID=2015173 RepID=A0A026WRZ6_OOCBI|nr:hypothetical protein X777_00976 [Ooceraea biroi]
MDGDVVELGNVESVCRLCLSTDETRSSVFAARDQEDSSGVPLATKIEACLSIQISSTDKVSTLICANCVKSVNQWHTYKESCLRSQDKLQEWLASHSQSNPKDEPMDVDSKDDAEVVSEDTSDLEETRPMDDQAMEDTESVSEEVQEVANKSNANENVPKDADTTPSVVQNEKETDRGEDQVDQQDSETLRTIKSEPQDDDDTDCTVELESTNSSELLLNPMAVGTEDTVMEADSTQKSNAAGALPKKKLKRGPHTHFRGTRVFKKKCVHCQIFLHSKYTYLKHMKRFHNKENGENSESISQNDEEEMIEDIEDELISMEKESPLTQVQQDIISQLKTFSCYTCDQTFNDRRSTLSHIRQHLPDLRPYTCIACLTEFPDRSMYQLHCGASFECAMKIALVVPKRGSERYFTCNMCLRSLHGRKELLGHLSKHSDKQYEEMMSPARSPPKLKPMTPLPSEGNSANAQQVVNGPYKNGDPAHNHACDLCGMIYRYRPNMFKHREFCRQLPPEARMSYRCAHCQMTFLVFKKFHSHITVAHKKKEFLCYQCGAKFLSPSDYLTHHEKHRASAQGGGQVQRDGTSSQNAVQALLKERNAHEAGLVKSRIGTPKFSCALCSQEFSTRLELTEHRNLHVKVKIYSCIICRSMFSSPSALEIHMKDHGIEDPNERNANISCIEYGSLDEGARIEDLDLINASATSDPGSEIHECNECGRVLSNYANLRRHTKMVHRNATIYDCNMCSRMFTCKELYDHHMQIQHLCSKTMLQCPQCPKSFVFQSNFNYHFRTAHLEKSTGYGCDICGKVFVEGASLKIHRGWHNRANSRLSTRFVLGDQKLLNSDASKDASIDAELATNSERPARARKSFPNPPPQLSGIGTKSSSGNFQCQVCNDKFNDVTELRSHLWDVHCARNKPEKSFSNNELQCELCTNVFPDQETLATHMQWHRANPILSDIRKTYSCDVCGKSYSSRKVLWKHKKLHKATVVASLKFQSLARKPMATQFMCTFCRKIFSSSQSLQRHKISFHSEAQNQQRAQSQPNSTRRFSESHEDEPRLKRMKVEIDDDSPPPKLPPFAMDFAGEKRKPVMCHVCQKMFPNMSVLYKHKQIAHENRTKKERMPECVPMTTRDGKYSCNVCFKVFPGLSNLRQHFTIKHKKTFHHRTAPNRDRPVPLPLPITESPKEIRETTYTNNVMYSCKLCKQCHVFNKQSIISHVTNVHNAVYQTDSNAFHREVNLGAYMVHGAVGTTCPRCNVKYPNNRALKIHYVKFHDSPDHQ